MVKLEFNAEEFLQHQQDNIIAYMQTIEKEANKNISPKEAISIVPDKSLLSSSFLGSEEGFLLAVACCSTPKELAALFKWRTRSKEANDIRLRTTRDIKTMVVAMWKSGHYGTKNECAEDAEKKNLCKHRTALNHLEGLTRT